MPIVTRDTLASLHHAVDAHGPDVLVRELRDLLQQPLQLQDLQRLERWVTEQRQRLATLQAFTPIRVAILGGHTTQAARAALVTSLLAEGRLADVYEAPYDTFRAEALDDTSQVYAWAPELILLATGTANIQRFPRPGDSEQAVGLLVAETLDDWHTLWLRLARTGATILQENFVAPAEAAAGRLEARVPWSVSSFVTRLNRAFWDMDGRAMRIVDVSSVAECVGRERWLDRRWYFHSKQPFSPALAGEYARLVSGTLRAVFGTTRNCLVIDLDNTLWGGTIGDDGLDGIRFGPGTAEGEAHQAFAGHLKRLADRGVLLAVCSKNEERTARQPFEQLPSMPLRLTDFAAFVCNWEPKPDTITRIADELNIGLDSLVFIDDAAAECAAVREALPAVWVVQAPVDPARSTACLDALRAFDTLELTTEDVTRAASYAVSRTQRAGPQIESLEEYLTGLEMTSTVVRAEAADLPRIEQLFMKTHQFNLTGDRWSAEQLRQMAGPSVHCLVGRLTDRMTAYGLVSAILARIDGDRLRVDNWVISCRAFSRTLEDFVLIQLLELARGLGCSAVGGRFVSSARNVYAERWLRARGLLDDSGTSWRVSVSQAHAISTRVSAPAAASPAA